MKMIENELKNISKEDWIKIKKSFALQAEFYSTVAAFKVFRYTSIDGVEEQIKETPIGENVFFLDYSYNGTPKINKCKVIEVQK